MTLDFNTEDFDFLKSLIRKAGDAARQIQNRSIEITRKSDTTIVTQADLMVQESLLRGIAGRYDGLHYIHEENNPEDASNVNENTLSVIIDPIDGTAMYSMYLPEWCVSVGIFRGYIPVYGFVYSPGFNMFFHNDDDGAYLNDRAICADKNIAVDSETNIFCASEVKNEFRIDFPGKTRNLGSTALHACLTADSARNRTLAFIGRSRLWDWAGAIPIATRAGVSLRYISGEEIDYRNVMQNNFRFLDYVLAYSSNDFETVRNMFKKN
jgi:fructose-1,6-bisphosphatase/inositol monophosphatase family enzyme